MEAEKGLKYLTLYRVEAEEPLLTGSLIRSEFDLLGSLDYIATCDPRYGGLLRPGRLRRPCKGV